MSKKKATNFGDVNISDVSGNVSLKQAGRDIIEKNEIVTTTVSMGFKQEEDKQKFIQQLEMIHAQLQAMRTEVTKVEGVNLNEDDKYALINAITEQLKELGIIKNEAKDLPIAIEPSLETAERFKNWVNSIKKLFENAKAFGEEVAEIQLKLEPYVEKGLSLLAIAKSFIGI